MTNERTAPLALTAAEIAMVKTMATKSAVALPEAKTGADLWGKILAAEKLLTDEKPAT